MKKIFKEKNLFRFSVDEIYIVNLEKEIFAADIIPVYNAQYFPANLIKTFKFHRELLEKKMYVAIISKYYSEEVISTNGIDFLGQVVQGGFYIIEKEQLKYESFTLDNTISIENKIFNNTRVESPYNDFVEESRVLSIEQGVEQLSQPSRAILQKLYLYCFNVGQGDSFFIITPNGSSYIIDTNYPSRKKVEYFISNLKEILKHHGLNTTKIKALIVTHKHIDHIRGANVMLNKAEFDIDYFLINHDYKHDLRTVELLLDAAKVIPNWININKTNFFMDGEVKFEIVNPDIDTVSRSVASDINDSSITIQITYGNDTIILTGDTGHKFLYNKIRFQNDEGDTLLKVSHHGSRTGTNDKLLEHINPTYAFISAGNSKKYRHPHSDVVSKIENKTGKSNIDISKKINFRRLYVTNGNGIIPSYW